ncbi:hypothetical protein D3C81_1433490 [compost metagenome]
MTAGLGADCSEGAELSAVLLHVLATGAAKHQQCTRHIGDIGSQLVDHALGHVRGGTRAIIPGAFKGTGLHLFETERQGTLDRTTFHGLARQEQGAGAGGAVVVDVDHRDAAHAHFVECGLATGGVTVDVAGIGLLNQVVIQAGILQGQANGLGAHLDVGAAGARLDERDHADAGNVRFLRHY